MSAERFPGFMWSLWEAFISNLDIAAFLISLIAISLSIKTSRIAQWHKEKEQQERLDWFKVKLASKEFLSVWGSEFGPIGIYNECHEFIGHDSFDENKNWKPIETKTLEVFDDLAMDVRKRLVNKEDVLKHFSGQIIHMWTVYRKYVNELRQHKPEAFKDLESLAKELRIDFANLNIRQTLHILASELKRAQEREKHTSAS